ncbi:MAG: hypothetical protein WC422_03725 [Candidatus Paceibacterota bacterium]|jgi:hypothetical protein
MDIREECCSSIRGLNSFIFGFLAVVLIIMQFIFLYNISSKNSIALSENKIHAEAKENPSEGKLINVFWG